MIQSFTDTLVTDPAISPGRPNISRGNIQNTNNAKKVFEMRGYWIQDNFLTPGLSNIQVQVKVSSKEQIRCTEKPPLNHIIPKEISILIGAIAVEDMQRNSHTTKFCLH